MPPLTSEVGFTVKNISGELLHDFSLEMVGADGSINSLNVIGGALNLNGDSLGQGYDVDGGRGEGIGSNTHLVVK